MVGIFRVDEGKVPGRWGSFAGGVVQVPWGIVADALDSSV